jgi:hypothetical protein
VEPGRYRGTRNETGFDGLWRTKEGEAITVEVKTTDAYRLSLVSLDVAANYRKRLIRSGAVEEVRSSILYVVGRHDTGDLEAQIRGSRHAWDIRIISIDALVRLVRVKEELATQETMDRIRDILMPREFTRVGGIIDLLRKIAPAISGGRRESDQSRTSRFLLQRQRGSCCLPLRTASTTSRIASMTS